MALVVAFGTLGTIGAASARHAVSVAPPPVSTVPVPRTDWARERQDEVLRRVRDASTRGAAPGDSSATAPGTAPARVVFIGDSITQGWEGEGAAIWRDHFAPLGAINLGVSGDRTEHVLWRLQQAPLTAIDPNVVVIMIGTNNAGGGADPLTVVQGVRAVVSTVLEQCPRTTVLLLDIFPRGENFNELRGRLAQANQALSRVEAFGADRSRVKWLPIGGVFLENDGAIAPAVMPDAVHLSAEGYARWERAMRDVLDPLVARKAASDTPASTAPVVIPK